MPNPSSGDSGRFLPGTLLAGRYRIVALVGRGGMGEVYRADDLKLGQTVALKFLPEAMERDEERRARFLGEIRIARQISHPNVCRVYDVGEVDGQHFLSMEYVDGEDLASLLRQIGRLPHEKAVQIARELCAGLHAAHEQGILHRDLKPANIMIDGRGRTRITDFGLAGVAAEFAGEEVRAGTPAYMAPEQLAGKDVTVRSDLYALGLVLYELFTGRAPFKGDRTEAFAFQRQETPSDTPSDLLAGMDPAVERAVMRCLQPDPAKRPASALLLAAALPGGDPLAAAIAAGETPSPELVAEAGAAGGLTPTVALLFLVVFALGILGIAAMAPTLRITSMVPPGKPSEVLVERAREIVRTLGYTDRFGDSEHSYQVSSRYLEYIADHDSSLHRWKRLAKPSPAPFLFWYRQSPRPLVPFNQMSYFGPQPSDPPLLESGMLRVQLTPQGNLQSFLYVPSARDSVGPKWPEPNWQALFAAADLDSGRFARVPSLTTPPYYAERRVAWLGTDPGDSTIPLRVEAAAFHGKPIQFSLVRPWNRPAREGPRASAPWDAATQVIGIVLFLACCACAGFLARRNIRLGRSDRRTAIRLAVLYVILCRLAWLVGVRHVHDPAEINRFFVATGFDMLVGFVMWLFYLALEPYLRRLWPTTLTSWIRVMDGRLRDPLVARDVLIGCLAGVAFVATWVLSQVALPWIGLPPARPDSTSWISWELGTLDGPWITLGMQLYWASTTIVQAILDLMALLLIRLAFRKAIPSYVVWLVLMAFVSSESHGNAVLAMGLSLAQYVLALVLLLRFGILVVVVGTYVYTLMVGFPLTLDLGAWNATGGIMAMLTLGALATYGFVVSLGGRPIFRDVLPEAPLATRAQAGRPGS
jgi:serine/threonine-protein kinase